MPTMIQDNIEFRIQRRYTPYVVSTWEKFRVSDDQVKKLDFIVMLNSNLKEQKAITKLKKNLKTVYMKTLIRKHFVKNDHKEVTKRSLASLFRAFGAKVLPPDLFGSTSNNRILTRNMNVLFSAGQGTSLWASDMLHSMDLTVIKWLTNNQDQEILLKLVVWIGEYVFWNLLKSFCHVTEKATGRKEIFFYQKRDFQKLANSSFHHFTSKNILALVDKNFRPKLFEKFTFTPVTAKCRIFPKKSLDSYRIICRTEKLDSENLADSNLRVLLEFAASTLFENSVDIKHRGFTFHQMLSRYCKEKRVDSTENHYVVVADIKDAYGSINHDKMETILKYVVRKLPNDIYIHTVKYRYTSSSKFICKTLASPNKNLEIDEIPMVRGAQYVGQEIPIRMDSKQSMMTVAKRIRLHTIAFKMGSKKSIYSVKQGILQGDPLSAPLCNIYYGHLMKTQLSDYYFCQNSDKNKGKAGVVFARGMDDFIFITTDRSKAESFLYKMHHGFSEYNCIMQKSKMATNLQQLSSDKIGDAGDMAGIIRNGKTLKFCGAILDPKWLHCRPDFQVFHGSNIAYASSLWMYNKDFFRFIMHKMMFVCGLYIKPIYVDVELNGREGVLKNMFELSYINALKLHSMLASLYSTTTKKKQPLLMPLNSNSFLKNIILKMAAKVKRHYCKVVFVHKFKNDQYIDVKFVYKVVIYACQVVFKEKYASFYSNQKIPLVRTKKEVEVEVDKDVSWIMLKESLKGRETFRIKSHAYQRI